MSGRRAFLLGGEPLESHAKRLATLLGRSMGRWAFLTTPLTSTSWDGDTFSDVASSTQLDLSAVFGAPAGISAVLLQMICRESNVADGLYFACGPSSTYWYATDIRPQVSNIQIGIGPVVVPTDANGDLWYRINASGANTMELWLRIWGYCKKG